MAFSLKAHTIKGSVGGGSVTTNAIDCSAADVIFACVSGLPSGSTAGSVSDSAVGINTWFGLTLRTDVSGLGFQIFYTSSYPAQVSAAQTFTVDGAKWTFPSIAICAFSGNKGSNSLDQQNGANGGGTTPTSFQPGSITPGEDNELLITGVSNGGGITSYSVDSGFTISDQFDLSGGNHFPLGMAYLIQTTATAKNPTWSWTSGQVVAAAQGSFKAAAGASIRGCFLPVLGVG